MLWCVLKPDLVSPLLSNPCLGEVHPLNVLRDVESDEGGKMQAV